MTESVEIKQQINDALTEFFRSDNEVLRNMISEVIEDIALGKAMESGDQNDYVDEQQILDLLKSEKK